MSWRLWKVGFGVAFFLSLLVAGSGLLAGTTWRQFTAVFCAACATHFLSFLKDHPVEQIKFDTKPPFPDGTNTRKDLPLPSDPPKVGL